MCKTISKVFFSNIMLWLIFGFFYLAKAQSTNDVLRYSLQFPGYDPVTMVMPGVATATGFGAYQENPAVMALFDESYFSAGLSDRYVSEKTFYLNNPSTFDINSLGISNAGLVYKVPTSRGSLVVGGGYSQTTGYNRATSGFGFNDQTTLTDYYAGLPVNDIYLAAYSAYAIYEKDFPDNTYLPLSIFRAPSVTEYRGVNQQFEITQEGVMGEYSAFLATELFKNFYVGASIGAISGDYTFQRSFLESDGGNYDGARLETDNDAQPDTDVDHIVGERAIRESFTGFSARLGVLYQITPDINIGAGYQFKNILFIDRETDIFITNTLDNGLIYEGEVLTEYKYKVIRPARLTFGFALKDVAGFTLSAMAERVDYSTAEIEFDDFSDLDNNGIPDDREISNFIASNLTEVINLRFGLAYKINQQFTSRVGYGFYPNPDSRVPDNINADRQFFSGGFTARISEDGVFNVGVQYASWERLNTLYITDIGTSEQAKEQVHRWNIMAGFTYYID